MFAPAVFLDKDGTLIEDVPHNVDPGRMQLMPGVAEGLRILDRAGYRLIVISNQPGVALGYFSEAALQPVAERLHSLFMTISAPLAGFYYCPHHPEGTVADYRRMACICRKPSPGLIFRAAFEHKIDLYRSWFVGDILDDIEAGRRAGCRTILIDNGHETEWLLTPPRRPHFTVADLYEATYKIIMSEHNVEIVRPRVLMLPKQVFVLSS
jgi:histidinol-phosphate phosphatase family protein